MPLILDKNLKSLFEVVNQENTKKDEILEDLEEKPLLQSTLDKNLLLENK